MKKNKRNNFYLLTKEEQHSRLKEIAFVFFKIGLVAFG